MITPSQAETLILQHSGDVGIDSIPLGKATGRILREPILADRDMPPFNRSTMDGAALCRSAFESGQRTFPVESVAAAGHLIEPLNDPAACIRIMTGAMLPEGADTVVPVEEFTLSDTSIEIRPDYELPERSFIHPRGSDAAAGTELLSPGVRMTAPRIGTAASVGMHAIKVSRSPRIAVISTGDEIVRVEHSPEVFQIRGANSYSIQASLKDAGFPDSEQFHLPDDADQIRSGLTSLLESFDLLILSGGVSMGEFDLVPGALEDIGVQEIFHKVSQRPGKPLWFGQFRGLKNVFGLPGNPLSTLTCLHRYVIPSLLHMSRIPETPQPTVELASDIAFRPALSFFPLVTVTHETGRLLATPLASNTSGDLKSPALSDGFIECPASEDSFKSGEIFPYWPWTS